MCATWPYKTGPVKVDQVEVSPDAVLSYFIKSEANVPAIQNQSHTCAAFLFFSWYNVHQLTSANKECSIQVTCTVSDSEYHLKVRKLGTLPCRNWLITRCDTCAVVAGCNGTPQTTSEFTHCQRKPSQLDERNAALVASGYMFVKVFTGVQCM